MALPFGTSAWAQSSLPQRRVDIAATLAANYDSNLLKLPDDAEPTDRQRSRADYRLSPALTLDLNLPLGRQSVFLNGAAAYDFYALNTQLNNEKIQFTGGADLNASACGARLAASYTRQQSDFADVRAGGLIDSPSDTSVKNIETRWLYQGDLTCGSPAGLRPTFGYRHERVENADPQRRSGNHSANTVEVGIGFSRPALGELSVGSSYSKSSYDDRPQGLPGAAPAAIETYAANVSFVREFGSQITGSVRLGLTKVDPNQPDVRPYRGFAGALNLTWTPGTRIQTTISASRDAQQSNLLSISYAIVDSFSVSSRYALNDRVTLNAEASYARRSLRDSASTPDPLLQGDDRTYRAAASALFAFNQRVSVSLEAGRDRRRSDNGLFDYDNVSVALTTKLAF